MPLTRDEVIRTMVDRQGHVPYKVMCDAVKLLIDDMVHALRTDHRIEVRGFGSFALRSRPPRIARNPKTGASVNTPETFAVHFKPGKELRERVIDACSETN